MGDVAILVPTRAEIDVAEIDEEPLASRRQPALQRQQVVLDLVVDPRELESGGDRRRAGWALSLIFSYICAFISV